MKAMVRCLIALSFTLMVDSVAHAQCAGGPNASCVTSFTIAPNDIIGDNSQYATATATAHLAPGFSSFTLELHGPNGSAISESLQCLPPAMPLTSHPNSGPGCLSSGNSVTLRFSANNSTGSPRTDTIVADAAFFNDPGISQTLTVETIPNPTETPANDPDLPCDHGCAGQPLNVANGNTWITQQDYSIPGLGGGLKLTRTWNSLWTLTNPPELSGIFGNSWRSNFEERIQVLTGGVVKYWKGNGSSLFYTYNSFSGAYNLTAPANDQTGLTFDSVTGHWIVFEKNGTQRVFNNAGYLTSIADPNGNTVTINVDANNQNRIASVTDATGRVLTFNYANGSYPRLCTSISDSVGTFTTYNYNFSTGRLTQVVYPDGSQYNFNYNSSQSNTLISSVTDSLGKVLEAHTYDSQRRGLTSQQATVNGAPVNQVTVQYQYLYSWQNLVRDSMLNSTYVMVSNAAQRHYITNTHGNGYSCASCDFQGSSQVGLSDNGYQSWYTDANGNTTIYTYDTQGNMTSKSLPRGNRTTNLTGYDTWSYTYNSFGEVLTATDPLGSQAGDPNHTTTYSYDTHGNLLSVLTPSPDGGTTPGSNTSFTYNSNGTLATVTDPLNHTTTINYCPSGQSNCPPWMIQSITDANNKTTSYTYDGRGNRLTIEDPVNGSANPTTFTYDSMNRVSSITYPGETTSVQFHYDYRGRRDWVMDQNGNKTTYAYDDADRLISVTDAQSPTAGVTRYAYDSENHLTDLWDAASNHTQFSVFEGPNPMTVTFPSGYTESYNWDLNNNVTSKTDRKGQRITYSYDFQNRVWLKTYPDSSTVNYTFDPASRLSQVTDATGTYTFGYDNMSRLTNATTNYSFTTFGNKTVQYAYDAASNRTSMTDPQNASTTYAYDNLNRLASLIYNNQTPGFTFGYDDLSRRTSLTRPNGVNTSYGYDPASHLLSVLHQVGSTVLDGATYTYDQAGNRQTSTNQRTGTSLSYGYDNIYQLLSVTQGTTTTESYTYDIVGNRLSSLGVSPYLYNSSNELTSIPSGSYTYDKNGNTTVKPDGTQYTWDYENRLTMVVLPSSGGTLNFKYDPFGRRIQKTFTQGSTTTNYVYDGPNPLEELDQNGNVVAKYNQGLVVDDPLSVVRGGSPSYFDSAALGTVTSLSDSTGALLNTYTYDSFGQSISLSGTVVNPIRYTGREFDQETGIYYYRARYYDPSIGRFVAEDPLRFGGGANFYEYGQNSPIDFSDPYGLQSTTLPQGCSPPFSTPCGPSLYSPPVDTMPPLPPTPAVPGWWPGSGPGAGSSPNRGPSPSPSPRPGPNPGPTPTRNGNCSKHDNESCEQQRTRCLATSMADLPGHLWGHSRCMECYEGCIRNGGNWPSRVARTKGTVRCDYWNF